MKPIFSRAPSLKLRLVFGGMVALGVIIADSCLDAFQKIRIYMDTAVSPFFFVANSPNKLLDTISRIFSSKEQLELENHTLRQELFLKKSELLLLEQYKRENIRLRELLGSPLLYGEKKVIAKVISTLNNPYSDQIVIDKGSMDNVYEGQPVISDTGVVGQVISVGKFTSRVLLICDTNHALPVQVLRNGIRVIAVGNGRREPLQLEYLSDSSDLLVGDLLVTSGLGGRFPEGYPVAVVSSVKLDAKRGTTLVKARPTANFQHLRYLLVWGEHRQKMNPMTSEEVRQVAETRRIKRFSKNFRN